MVFSYFLKDYEPNQDFKVSSDYFKLAFKCMLHLFANGIFGMVFEFFQDYFLPKDFASGFHNFFNFLFILHKVTFHVGFPMSLEQPAF
jgi:hypothetical protein